jgi:hypothetical protein
MSESGDARKPQLGTAHATSRPEEVVESMARWEAAAPGACTVAAAPD